MSASRQGRASRAKGRKYENKIVEYLSEFGATRVSVSGETGEDVIVEPVRGVKFSIEGRDRKSNAGIAGTWLIEAEGHSMHGSEAPAVVAMHVTGSSIKNDVVAMRMSTFKLLLALAYEYRQRAEMGLAKDKPDQQYEVVEGMMIWHDKDVSNVTIIPAPGCNEIDVKVGPGGSISLKGIEWNRTS